MELNGVANIKLIVETALLDGKIDKEVVKKINEQTDMLIMYLNSLNEHIKDKENVIPWHQIREVYNGKIIK